MTPITIVLKTNCAPIVHEVIASHPGVRVIILDEDTEACDPGSVLDVDGGEHWVGIYTPTQWRTRVLGILDEIRRRTE